MALVLSASYLSAADDVGTWVQGLRHALENTTLPESIGKDAVEADERAFAREINRGLVLGDRLTGALATWFFAHDDESLELAWWRSKDPATRALIVSTYAAMTTEPSSLIPPFERYAKRFSEEEKQQRLTEIKWAEEAENRIMIARLISEWVKRNLTAPERCEFANRKLKAYERMAKSK